EEYGPLSVHTGIPWGYRTNAQQIRAYLREQCADGDGAHRVIIEGSPRIEVTVEATDEGENRSAGGNATAVGRLVGAVDWLVDAEPGLYDALDVPLRPAVGRLGRK
ncbi:hypothetical protein AB0885_27060, partial [Streptomyces sp. NPDC005534]